MRIGCIADVHANLPALEAVLDDMPPVDVMVCAGDVVGYNPWPGECVDAVRDRSAATVMGNHERALVDDTPFRFNAMAAAGVRYARDRLSDDQRRWLAGLPPITTAAEGRIRIAHGHPDDPDRYTYPESFSASMLTDERLLVLGHTHVQGVRRFEEGIVLNPGGVGQPRDGDPRAAYAVVDLDDEEIQLRRCRYDIDRVVERVAEAGLPESIGTRLYEGR